MPKRTIRRGFDGRLEKFCNTCGKWKDFPQGFDRRLVKGKNIGYHKCKGCRRERDRKRSGVTNHGYVEFKLLQPIVLELTTRIGRAETARRTGLHKSYITALCKYPPKRVHKDTYAKFVIQLSAARKNAEMYDKGSIQHGNLMRGKPVKARSQVYLRWNDD